MLLFFFSSRRRHTRWTGDWSSDVCSSDLVPFHWARWLAVLPPTAVKNPPATSLLLYTVRARISLSKDAPSVVHEVPLNASTFRSEERRVGKECRSRWSA